MARRVGSGIVVCLLFLSFLRADLPPLVYTPKKPVVEVFHGHKIADDYRWLEDAKDPYVRRWVLQQNRRTRAYFDRLPARSGIFARLQKLNDTPSLHYDKLNYQGGTLFAQSSHLLVTLRSPDEPDEEIVADAEEVTGKTTAEIDFFAPSPDGKKIAASISFDGKEEGTVHVFDVESGKQLDDLVPNVRTPLGGSLAWKGDGSGFFYTRHDPPAKPGENLHQHIYFHKLGSDVRDDVYSLGREFAPIADATVETSPDGKYILATVSTGWSSEHFTHYLLGPDRPWIQLAAARDQIMSVWFGQAEDLYLLSFKEAPRGQIVKLTRSDPDLANAKVVVPQSDVVIHQLLPTKSRLIVQDRVNGASGLRVFDLQGNEQKPISLPADTHVQDLVLIEGDDILYQTESYLRPMAWHRYDAIGGTSRRTQLDVKYPDATFKGVELVRDFALANDGAKIPLSILRPKALKLDGNHPVLLTGYGGYGQTMDPTFDPNRQLWLEHGGVWAVAHLRGDGDFGEDWHRAALGPKRQVAYDDFAACARHLIDKKYTNPKRLAVEGASNGGALMGAMITQHPQLFRAVVTHVGVYDFVRQDQKHRGFDVAEFGSAKDPEQFKALWPLSPYHRVQDGTAYPAVLLTTGENDGRVDPAETWKMAARLQAASKADPPILLWTSANAGHQLGNDSMSVHADTFAFLFHELDVPFKGKISDKKGPKIMAVPAK